MDHLLLKAATSAATDQGVFDAVISTATVDREKDIVNPSGMVRALQKWAALGKKIPLAWQHSAAPEDQIGYIDPASAKAVGNEVHVSGYIDQATEVGAHAWRMVKMGTLGFSFGYLIPDGGARARKGGGRQINEVDVYEVTATPAPMNGDTRVLGFKAMGDTAATQLLNSMLGQAQKFIDSEDDADDIAAMRQIATLLRRLGAAEASEPDDSSEDGKSIRRELAEIQRDMVRGELAEVKRMDVAADPAGALSAIVEQASKHADVAVMRDIAGVAEEVGANLGKGVRLYTRLVDDEEMAGTKSGELKAVWSTAYVNNLPDSAFLYVKSGEKDSESKTFPRSSRHFPYKDADGSIDLPHLRNALSRIPQADLPQSVKDSATARAQALLDDAGKSLRSQEAPRPRAANATRREADQALLDLRTGGVPRVKSPTPVTTEPSVQAPTEEELRRETRDLLLKSLVGNGVGDADT